MTEQLLTNITQLVSIVHRIALAVLAAAILVWAPTIWRALRGESKQDTSPYLVKIAALTDRLENETTTVYLEHPDGTPYAGPINAKLALEALQSAQEAELDLRIRFADDPPTLEQYYADHAEN